ncbi:MULTISPECIES: hypothetical protein [Snodgrassella]|uniref:hypothetical protein n=1 Tax=Snodgrassella TaxID=1193515 RepID=UPI00226AF6D9|nr:hypothetical protein [Snodgrassella sp. B3800]MCX8747556.1 hypothetical protein [Snodgrassella sp. B3800]
MNSNHSGWEPFAAMRDEMPYPSEAEIKKYGLDGAWKRKLVYRIKTTKAPISPMNTRPIAHSLS